MYGYNNGISGRGYNPYASTSSYNAYNPSFGGGYAGPPRVRRASLGAYAPAATYFDYGAPQYVDQSSSVVGTSLRSVSPGPVAMSSPIRRPIVSAPVVAKAPPEDDTYYTITGEPSSFHEPKEPDQTGMVTTVEHRVMDGHIVNVAHKHAANSSSNNNSSLSNGSTSRSGYGAVNTSGTGGLVNDSLTESMARSRREEVAFAVDISPALASGPAGRQAADRRATLESLRDSICQFIDDLAAESVNVDGEFDETVVTTQLDDMLPSAVDHEVDAEERIRREQGPQDYAKLKALVAEIKERAGEVDPEYLESFNVMIESAEAAIDLLDGTRNRDVELQYINYLEGVLNDLNSFMNVPIPNTAELHQDAMKADAACVAFEKQRETYDWTEDMGSAENALYTKVNSVLEETAKESANSSQVLADLIKFTHPAMAVDVDVFKAARAKFLAAQNSLKERDAVEKGKFERIRAGFDAETERAAKAEKLAMDNAVRLGQHIKNLAQDMAEAYLSVWQAQKTQAVIQRSVELLHAKQRVNEGLADHQEEEIENLLQDVDSAIQVSLVAENMMATVNKNVEDLRTQKEREVAEDLFKIEVERLKLISRKYYKASLAMFAAESSIEILKQEQEGVLVKKKRSNAAKNSEWVAECNREFDELERRVNAEEANRAELAEQLNDIASTRAEVFDLLCSLPLTKESKAKIPPLEVEWKLLLDRLTVVESEQLSKVELANHLDAGFLSQSYTRGSR